MKLFILILVSLLLVIRKPARKWKEPACSLGYNYELSNSVHLKPWDGCLTCPVASEHFYLCSN